MTKLIVLAVICVSAMATAIWFYARAIRALRSAERNADRAEQAPADAKQAAADAKQAAADAKRDAEDSRRLAEEALRILAFDHLDIAAEWRLLGDVDRAEAHEARARSLATIGEKPNHPEE